MIDTIKFRISGEWRTSKPDRFTLTENRRKDEAGESYSRFYHDQETGLRIIGDSCPQFVECSLPRQIFPSNGYLIKTNEQLSESLKSVYLTVSDAVDSLEFHNTTRLDTVWQFTGHPPSWIQAFSCARWPGARKEPRLFFAESVEWCGSSQVLRAYDKHKEQTGESGGEVIRIEHQTRSRLFADTKSSERPTIYSLDKPESITIENAYKYYRSRVVKLPAFKSRKPGELTIAGFLAYIRARKILVDGMPLEDNYILSRSRSQQFKIRAAMSRASLQELELVDFQTLCPVDRLPDVVECTA